MIRNKNNLWEYEYGCIKVLVNMQREWFIIREGEIEKKGLFDSKMTHSKCRSQLKKLLIKYLEERIAHHFRNVDMFLNILGEII